MVIPVGRALPASAFICLKKQNGKLINEALRPTLFVPMTGEAEKSRKIKPDPTHPQV